MGSNLAQQERSLFWYWEGAVERDVCDRIVDESTATLFAGTERERVAKAHLPRMHTIECVVGHYIVEANRSMGWNLALTNCVESASLTQNRNKTATEYRNDLMIYKHPDVGFVDIERKLTGVLLLSNETTYKGGSIRFPGIESPPRTQGTIIVFPSFVWHKIDPVTKGVTLSATVRYAGPRFQ